MEWRPWWWEVRNGLVFEAHTCERPLVSPSAVFFLTILGRRRLTNAAAGVFKPSCGKDAVDDSSTSWTEIGPDLVFIQGGPKRVL